MVSLNLVLKGEKTNLSKVFDVLTILFSEFSVSRPFVNDCSKDCQIHVLKIKTDSFNIDNIECICRVFGISLVTWIFYNA